MSQAQNAIALGSVKTGKTKTGWKYDIHNQRDSTKTKKHIHIEKGKDKYSQNEDGSPHDGTTGSPPNSVKKELKEKGIWDWDANAEKYIKEVAVEIPNYAEEFPFLIAPGSVHGGALGASAASPALPAVPSFSPVPAM